MKSKDTKVQKIVAINSWTFDLSNLFHIAIHVLKQIIVRQFHDGMLARVLDNGYSSLPRLFLSQKESSKTVYLPPHCSV